MLSMLNDWKGTVEVNGVEYDSIKNCRFDTTLDSIHIILHSAKKKQSIERISASETIVTVKSYMTKKATAEFDFMKKWNNDVPMPLRTMVGKRIKETRGMAYYELHGDIVSERVCTCMKCGRTLTNPVSQYFGIGPECGGHNYVNPFNSEAELRKAVASYKEELRNVKWSGWIIKSAIISEEEYE